MGRYDEYAEESAPVATKKVNRYAQYAVEPARKAVAKPKVNRYAQYATEEATPPPAAPRQAEQMQGLRQRTQEQSDQQDRTLGAARYAAPMVNPLLMPLTTLGSPLVMSALNQGSQAMAPAAREVFAIERQSDLAQNLAPATRAGLQREGRTDTQHLESITPTGTNDVLDNPILRRGMTPPGLEAANLVNPQAIRDQLRANLEYVQGHPMGDGTDNFGPATRMGLDRRAQTMQQRAQQVAADEAAAQAGGLEGAAARAIPWIPASAENTYDVGRAAGMSPEIAMATEAVADPQNIIEALPLARIAGVGKGLARTLGVGDDIGAAFARGMDETASELARPAIRSEMELDILRRQRPLKTAQQVAEQRVGRYAKYAEPEPATLPTAQEAARRRVSLQEQEDVARAAARARQAEIAAQERLAELAPGEQPSLILPEQRAPRPLEVVTSGPRAVRETISPERDAEIAQQVAEGQAREAEILARREAELADQPRSSTLEIPGQTPAPSGRLVLPGQELTGPAGRIALPNEPTGVPGRLIVPEGAAPAPAAPGGRYAQYAVEDVAAPAVPGRRIPLGEGPAPKPAAAAADPEDYINRRAFGEVAESPVYNDLQRVQREITDLDRERMRVERQGAGPLSREARDANLKQSDALRRDAERLQAQHDQLRQVAAQDAAQFRQAYRRGEAAIPGPASLEQGYAPRALEATHPMGTPQPGPGRGAPPSSTYPPGALVQPPAPQPARRQSLVTALTSYVTGKKPDGTVKSKVELIREMGATLDKMDSVKTVYGMGAGANRKTPARFLSKVKLIEIKRGNLTGFLHEVGHAFDERQAGNFSRRSELAGELDALGSQGHSSWKPGMPDLRRRQEGVAEFIRLNFEDPAEAARQYPKMSAAFEQHLDEMGDLGAEWRKHQEAVQLHITSPGAARASAQITDRPDELWKFGKISNTVAALVDRYSPLRAIDDIVEAFKGVKLAPTDRIYMQARLLKGQGKVKVKEFQDSLKELLKPINDMGSTASKNFSDFLTARHAIEMEEAGLNTGVSKQDWEDLVRAHDLPEFRQVADDLYAWQRSINDYAIAEGNLDPMKVDEWYAKWKHYVPTNREMENVVGWVEPKGFSGGGSRGLKASRGPAAWVKRKTGGHQRIYRPIETMLQNMSKIVDSTERNRIGKMLSQAWDEDTGSLAQHLRELKPTDLAGKQYVTVRDGNPTNGTFRTRYFEFTNEETYKAFTAMDEKQLGGFVRFLSLPAGLLRWGATKISLPFVLNNLQRDTVGSALNSRVGSLPIRQSLDGLYTVLRAHLGHEASQEIVEGFSKSGGLQGLDEMYGSPASAKKAYHDVFSSLSKTERALAYVPKEFRGVVRGALKTPGFLLAGKVNVGQVKGVPIAPFSILEALADLSEQATRVGEFKQARKFFKEQNPTWSEKDIDQAAGFEAMDLLDFDLRGNNEAIRIMRSIIPFSGSSVTGLYRNIQAARENPRMFAAKSFALLAAPTMALYALNRNNPYYWELTQQDRDAHWHIPIPAPLAKKMGITNPAEQFFRFKKPFLMGTLGGATVERMAQYGFEKDPRAFEGLATAIASQSTPATVDDLGGPIYKMIQELNANIDLFRDRPIEAEYQRKGPGQLPSYLRSDEYSSITARMISKAIHDSPLREHLKFSPLQIDHLIRGTTGGGGESIVKGKLFGNVPGLNRLGIDPVLSALTGQEEAKASRKQFLGQVPSEGRHESEDRFFERLGQLRETVNDPDNPESKKMAGKLNQYESTEKRLKKLYKQRAQTKDETQRARVNRLIVRETERLEPPTGRQKELRQK